MSKIIYICAKSTLPATVSKKIREICAQLAPDNINPALPKIVISDAAAYGIMNPVPSIQEHEGNVLLGHLYEQNVKWSDMSQSFLDGSFALFRNNQEFYEIVSDPAGSRTIWYYMDDEIFVSSTSQRAITMLIGSFEFDQRVIPWILSTGTLGPSFSWDKRIQSVPVDSSVTLDKKKWSICKKSNARKFEALKQSDEQHEKRIRKVLLDTFESLNLDFSSWVLPLSGGYDSRGILCLFSKTSQFFDRLKTITWGLKSSFYKVGNDAYIADKLAKALNVAHKYYPTDLSDEPVEQVVNRFLLLGEGRIDHISGYMDGFKIWKDLYDDNVKGVVRGDEGFGFFNLSSPLSIRHTVGCGLCADYSNLKDYRKHGFPAQEVPENLVRQKGETLAAWRDKVYHEFRIPVILPALSDLKLSYVELINPLLSRKILSEVRQLPDHLRTNKILFSNIVSSLSPNIDFTSDSAIAPLGNLLKKKSIVKLMKDEISSENAKSILPDEFLSTILDEIKTESSVLKTQSKLSLFVSHLKSKIPSHIKIIVRDSIIPLSLDSNVIAFRVYIMCRMNAILKDDSSMGLSIHLNAENYEPTTVDSSASGF